MKTLIDRDYGGREDWFKDGTNFFSKLESADKSVMSKDIQARIDYIKCFGIMPFEWYAELKYDLASMEDRFVRAWGGKHIAGSMVYDKYYPGILKRYFKTGRNYIEVSEPQKEILKLTEDPKGYLESIGFNIESEFGSYGRFCYAYGCSGGMGEPTEWCWSSSRTIESIIEHDLHLFKERSLGFPDRWFRVPGIFSPLIDLDRRTGELI